MFCLLGALVGTLVGVLPGVGTVATIAMLLPITFGLPPVGALIMLAGIYYGAQYGGSTTSMLVNIPGEATSVITCLDGHQMAKQGRAGPALAIAAIGSFFAGCVATVLVAALGAPLTGLALLFGPAEYFSLMVLGLIFAVVLAKGSVLKAVAMVLVGLLLSMVGSDLETGAGRMTFDIPELADGIGFANIAMGVFGFAEIIRNLELPPESRDILNTKVSGLMPNREGSDRCRPRDRARHHHRFAGRHSAGGRRGDRVVRRLHLREEGCPSIPERFGHGAIEGVAAPESANNAAAQTAFIPLLTLGIPPNAVMALMVGAMTIHGIVPGPQVMTKQPDLFWGMIASMWLGNLMLVIINLPLVGVWVTLLRVPYRLLFPSIIVFCCIGVYSINNSPFDVAHCGGLRRHRILAAQARFRAGPDAARLRAGAADGGEPSPRHADRARRRDGVLHPPDLGGVAEHRDPPADPRRDCRRSGVAATRSSSSRALLEPRHQSRAITAHLGVRLVRWPQVRSPSVSEPAQRHHGRCRADHDLLIRLDWTPARARAKKREAFREVHRARASCRLSPRRTGDSCLGRLRPCIGHLGLGPLAGDLHRDPLVDRGWRLRSGRLFHRRQADAGEAGYRLHLEGCDLAICERKESRPVQGQARGLRPAVRRLLCLGGVAGYTAKGDPRYWKVVDGKLYLNYDAGVQKDWEKDVPGNIANGDKNWPAVLDK